MNDLPASSASRAVSPPGVDNERLRARAIFLRELAQARALLARGPVQVSLDANTRTRWRNRLHTDIVGRGRRSGAA